MLGVPVRRMDDVQERAAPPVIEGPERLVLGAGKAEWDVLWFRVQPGEYSLDNTGKLTIVGNSPLGVTVPPQSVVLAPFQLILTDGMYHVEALNESDRQKAGRHLASFVNFVKWSNRELVGFGAVRPSLDTESIRYTVTVSVKPPTAEIYVDDVLIGAASMEFELTAGKHRLLIRAPGYEDAIYYIRLEGDAVVDANLRPAAADDLDAVEKERYATLVGSFVTLGDEEDQLARLFADTLLLQLEKDPRLDVVPSSVPWRQHEALIHPDFLPLEEVGADLVVSGFFETAEGQLTVQANLYDVQSESIRAAVTWDGRVGVDMFQAMDEIAVEFASEVDRVLPEAGRTLLERTETVYSASSRTEGRVARKQIVRHRWESRPHALSFHTGIGIQYESIPITENIVIQQETLGVPFVFSWDYDLGPLFALGSSALFSVFTEGDNGWVWYQAALQGGPRLVFRSLRADIIFGLDLRVQFSPSLVEPDPFGSETTVRSTFLYLQLPISVSFRYYFNKRLTTMPLFLSGSVAVTPGYRFDLDGTGQEGWLTRAFQISVGVGVRL